MRDLLFFFHPRRKSSYCCCCCHLNYVLLLPLFPSRRTKWDSVVIFFFIALFWCFITTTTTHHFFSPVIAYISMLLITNIYTTRKKKSSTVSVYVFREQLQQKLPAFLPVYSWLKIACCVFLISGTKWWFAGWFGFFTVIICYSLLHDSACSLIIDHQQLFSLLARICLSWFAGPGQIKFQLCCSSRLPFVFVCCFFIAWLTTFLTMIFASTTSSKRRACLV